MGKVFGLTLERGTLYIPPNVCYKITISTEQLLHDARHLGGRTDKILNRPISQTNYEITKMTIIKKTNVDLLWKYANY